MTVRITAKIIILLLFLISYLYYLNILSRIRVL